MSDPKPQTLGAGAHTRGAPTGPSSDRPRKSVRPTEGTRRFAIPRRTSDLPARWRAARKTVMPVAPTNAHVPMRPRVSRADAPPARVRRASAKTHAPSAKTIAAVDLARVGSGTLSSRPYVHKINNCNVCTYNVISRTFTSAYSAQSSRSSPSTSGVARETTPTTPCRR